MFACEKGYEDIVRKLLATPNCDISLKDNVSLHQNNKIIIISIIYICTYVCMYKKEA